MGRVGLTVVVMALAGWPVAAGAGILITEKTTTGTSVHTTQVQIEGNRIRVESFGAAGPRQTMIFDGGRQVLWIVNDQQRTYREMTRADADRIGGQVTGAMAQLQEQMKNLPPEQRAMMEKMMQGRGGLPGMGATPPPKTVYRQAGTGTVGRWTCSKYDGYQGDQKTSELCTVPPQTLGFADSDFDVTRQLGEFVARMSPQNASEVFTVGKGEEQGFSGVPVRRVFTAGQTTTTVELTGVSREALPASVFEVPAGFQKEAVGTGQRR